MSLRCRLWEDALKASVEVKKGDMSVSPSTGSECESDANEFLDLCFVGGRDRRSSRSLIGEGEAAEDWERDLRCPAMDMVGLVGDVVTIIIGKYNVKC